MPDTSRYPTNAEINRAKEKAVGGKKDVCIKGKSCSAACIAANEFCLVEIPSSPSAAISQVRDSLEERKERQLPLFDVGSTISEKDAKAGVDKFRRSVQKDILTAIEDGSKEDYNKLRDSVIAYNKKLVEDGIAEKSGLVKVPVTWEKLQKVTSAYNRAYDSLEERATNAALMGDRARYEKEERKLMALVDRLGSKIGNPDSVSPGDIWRDNDGDTHSRSSFLEGLRGSSMLRSATMSHDGEGELRISKMFGEHRIGITLSEHGMSFSFQINGSYNKPEGLGLREGLKIAKETERLFSEVVSHMEEGSEISVHPYGGDGRGRKRRAAYEKFGFATVAGIADMFGRVESGRIVPSDYDSFRDYHRGGDYNFAESDVDRVKTMYVALWGEEPR